MGASGGGRTWSWGVVGGVSKPFRETEHVKRAWYFKSRAACKQCSQATHPIYILTGQSILIVAVVVVHLSQTPPREHFHHDAGVQP